MADIPHNIETFLIPSIRMIEIFSSQHKNHICLFITAPVLTIIDNCIDIWLDAANQKGQNLVYYISKFGRRNPSEVALFASPEDFEGDASIDKWLVPNALRVIEPESVIHVIR